MISDHVLNTSFLTIVYAVKIGMMLEAEVLALAASYSLSSGRDLFLNLFADIVFDVFFALGMGFCSPLFGQLGPY
jgi:hypothetical protein